MEEKGKSEKIKKIVDEIEKMTVLELSQLVKMLEEKFGVSAIPQILPSQPTVPQEGEAAPATSEKSFFTVLLSQVGSNKIEAIKLVKEICQKGLKDSKDLVDQVASAPQVIKENIEKKEAEAIKEKFERIGCKVELR